ncbi:hypothetical protein I6M33_18425 [Shewanella algae]|uniref:hypothetical protein n=1 Tax=Shewanella algae TaxID=38313 RepID=UPI001AACF3BB|nr:hypothetical protein [Shewanella algae]MBO2562558.1 hypothetical protein [Shewanella algae]
MKLNTVIKSSVLAILFSSAAMAANPTKTLVWSGFVPSGQPGTELIITGLAGQDIIAKGDLNINTDGTFTSSTVTVEAHDYTEATSTIGELANAKWTLASADVSMGDTDLSSAVLVVKANDTEWAIGDEFATAENTLRINVAQTAELANVSGQSAQVSVTLMAAKDAGVAG